MYFLHGGASFIFLHAVQWRSRCGCRGCRVVRRGAGSKLGLVWRVSAFLSFPSLPRFLSPPFLSRHLHSSFPAPSLPLEVGPFIPVESVEERSKLSQRGLGRSPSRNQFWCILVLKSDIWWQQF